MLSGPAIVATDAEEVAMLHRDRHRAEAAGRDAEQGMRLALGADGVGPHHERNDLGDDVVLEPAAQPLTQSEWVDVRKFTPL